MIRTKTHNIIKVYGTTIHRETVKTSWLRRLLGLEDFKHYVRAILAVEKKEGDPTPAPYEKGDFIADSKQNMWEVELVHAAEDRVQGRMGYLVTATLDITHKETDLDITNVMFIGR